MPEPLCAVYHRDCRAAIDESFRNGVRKITDALAPLATLLPIADADQFRNVNTPADWTPYAVK